MTEKKPQFLFEPRWNWGLVLPHRGYGRCYRCRRPWWAAPVPHAVGYGRGGRGQFALCETCWRRSDAEARWTAHAWVCSNSSWTAEETWKIHQTITGDAQ